MSTKTIFRVSTALSAGGVLFAGYLSGTKLFTGTCAFNEPCPYFLGYPSCWYGFAMFVALFVLSLLAMLGRIERAFAARWLVAVAALGMIFAGSFVVSEVRSWAAVESGLDYTLGLPTCVYGLVFYIALFILSLMAWRRKPPVMKEKSGPMPQ